MFRIKSPARWALWLGWAALLLGCGNILGVVRSAQEAKATVEALVTEAPATLEAVASEVAPTLEAAAAQATPSAADAGAAPTVVDPQTVDAIRTYRLRWEYRFVLEDEQRTQTLLHLEMSVNKDQDAQQMLLRSHDGEEWAWVQIGDQLWTKGADMGWIMATEAGLGTELSPIDTEDLWMPLDEVSGWEPVGEETLNGQPTQHYRITIPEAAWAEEAQTAMSDWGLGVQYTLRPAGPAQGDAWLTADGWVVRYDIRLPLTAVDNAGAEHPARLEWSYEVWDINAPVDIQPPQGSDAAAAPVPVPPNAVLAVAQADTGMWAYTVQNSTLNEVTAFYRQQAEAGALTLEGEMGGSGMGFWQATVALPDGARYQIMAAPQGAAVMLTIQRP